MLLLPMALLVLGPRVASASVQRLDVDAATRQRVIATAAALLREQYVSAEIGERMAAALADRAARGAYDAITLGPALAQLLTFELREVSGDHHVGVMYSVESIPERADDSHGGDADEYLRTARRANFGFARLELLPGNLGYLDLRGFYRAEVAGATAAGAMAFLSDTDALIIDLRHNGGGSPSMVSLLATYLIAGEPVHLSDIVWRSEGRTESLWTLADVPGRRYLKPVYLLTSGSTFSAAEGFACVLQSLGRAHVIGETTAGGANAGRATRLGEHFSIVVPSGHAIDAVRKTSWEGVGVSPDVGVPAGIALETAQISALEALRTAERDPQWQRNLESAAREARAALEKATRALPPQPTPSSTGNTELRLAGAAYARRVAVIGSFNAWEDGRTLCAREAEQWVCRIDLAPGRHRYQFVIDGTRTIDPANPNMEATDLGDVVSVLVK
jgi:hypothetical protein